MLFSLWATRTAHSWNRTQDTFFWSFHPPMFSSFFQEISMPVLVQFGISVLELSANKHINKYTHNFSFICDSNMTAAVYNPVWRYNNFLNLVQSRYTWYTYGPMANPVRNCKQSWRRHRVMTLILTVNHSWFRYYILLLQVFHCRALLRNVCTRPMSFAELNTANYQCEQQKKIFSQDFFPSQHSSCWLFYVMDLTSHCLLVLYVI
jgi:hypothetical protein